MKRREFLTIAGVTVPGLRRDRLPARAASPGRRTRSGRIGFSQATTIEPWRAQFNKDIIAEAAKHPEVELIITDGEDRTEKQVADVENLIRQEVDALLISPKESAGLTGVVEQAIDAGIPVFVLDRNVETDRYTQFVGGDNVLIGKAAGEWTVEALGGAGKAEGNVVEIWGGMGTQPAHDRHDGFHELTDKEPGIKYLLERAVRRLEAGPGLRHHGDRAALQRGHRHRLRPQRPDGLRRLPRRQGRRPREATSSSSASTRCPARA